MVGLQAFFGEREQRVTVDVQREVSVTQCGVVGLKDRYLSSS